MIFDASWLWDFAGTMAFASARSSGGGFQFCCSEYCLIHFQKVECLNATDLPLSLLRPRKLFVRREALRVF